MSRALLLYMRTAVRAGGQKARNFSLCSVKKNFASQSHPDRLRGPPNGNQWFFHWNKVAGTRTLPLTSNQLPAQENFYSIHPLPYIFMVYCSSS